MTDFRSTSAAIDGHGWMGRGGCVWWGGKEPAERLFPPQSRECNCRELRLLSNCARSRRIGSCSALLWLQRLGNAAVRQRSREVQLCKRDAGIPSIFPPAGGGKHLTLHRLRTFRPTMTSQEGGEEEKHGWFLLRRENSQRVSVFLQKTEACWKH